MNRILAAFYNRLLGRRGEDAAARYLRNKGLRVITQGYRTRRGEIDLIARDGDTLVFVEVKTRRAGEPIEAVTPLKQRRIVLAALEFAKRHGILGHRARFDVVAIVWPEDSKVPTIQHYPHAFDAPNLGAFTG